GRAFMDGSDAAQDVRVDHLAVVPLRIGFECRPQPTVPAIRLRVIGVRVVRIPIGEDRDDEVLPPPLRLEDMAGDLADARTALSSPLLANRDEFIFLTWLYHDPCDR